MKLDIARRTRDFTFNALIFILFCGILVMYYLYVPIKWMYCKLTHQEFRWPLDFDIGA